MKIIMIEATAEELKANRTLMDGITDAVNNFAQALVGPVRLSSAEIAEALAKAEAEEDPEDET